MGERAQHRAAQRCVAVHVQGRLSLDPDSSFEHRSVAFGGDGLAGAAWLDYDNDGFLDLYLTNGKTQPNALSHNNQDGTFTDLAATAGVENGLGNSGVVAADFDNDGFQDLFLTGDGGLIGAGESTVKLYRAVSGSLATQTQHRNQRYLNTGNLTFVDVRAAAGIDTMLGACVNAFTDFDNGGRVDLLLGDCNDVTLAQTPLEVFRNKNGQTLTDVRPEVGVVKSGFWMGLCPADLSDRFTSGVVSQDSGEDR